MARLPIYELESDLARALSAPEATRRVVLQAPTGSGKSTQVPRMLANHPACDGGRILVLQPRRLAARMLAKRVAHEEGCRLGDRVGYQIRFEDRSSNATRIQFITEGVLLRRLLRDPFLEGISAVVFDEFHERNLFTDISLVRLLETQRDFRPDLVLVAMSATLETASLEKAFAPCTTLESEGRTFPVTIEYRGASPPKNRRQHPVAVWDQTARVFDALVTEEDRGDVLVFMPGAYEINRTIDALRRTKAGKNFDLFALHGQLRPEDQDRAVAPSPAGRRKVVVATNVAETSLTIEGIRLVIDAGLARVASFDPHRQINTLRILPISKAAADQRAGRAGRMEAGRCVRLWSERSHARREPHTIPEVRRVDLSEILLTLAGLGAAVDSFDWFEAPEPLRLDAGLGLLRLLGALDEQHQLTKLGQRMLAFPVHPRYARLLLAAADFDCVEDAALAAAIASARPFWLRRQPKSVEAARADFYAGEPQSDFTVLMRAWRYAQDVRFSPDACRDIGVHGQAAREVGRLLEQFLRIAKRERLPLSSGGMSSTDNADSETMLRRALLHGFSDQLALRRDGGTSRCLLSGGRKGSLSDDVVVRDTQLLVAADVNEIEGKDLSVLLAKVSAVDPEWLEEDFPAFFRTEEVVGYDKQSRQVVSETRRCFRDLILEKKPGEAPSKEAAAAFLAREIHDGNLALKPWNQKVEDWILRVNTIAEQCPELGFTPILHDDRLTILEQICYGGRTYRDVRDRSPWTELRNWLGPGLPALVDDYAPERVPLPSGRSARVRYEPGALPILSARIQHLYDLTGDVRIGRGNIKCRIEFLAPNNRPQQITEDIDSFWANGYPLIKKELKGRYPKHEWR